MKFIQEALRGVKRLDAEPSSNEPDDSLDIDLDGLDDLDDLDLELDGDAQSDAVGIDDPSDADLDDVADFDLELDGDANDPPLDDLEGFDNPPSSYSDDSFSLDGDTDTHPELSGLDDDAVEDPDRQGLVRTVKGAHLVYKRETDDGSFEELWVYNVSDLRGELTVKKAILAGTDIPVNKTQSPDGSQTYEIWSAGNAELILVRGLPN